MRIPVRLAGATLPWKYKDSDRLGAWIDSRPWTDQQTIQVVRVADNEAAALISDSIQDAVAAADRGQTGISTIVLDTLDVAQVGFRGAVARYDGISLSKPEVDIARMIGRELADRPKFFLINAIGLDRPQIIDETECFVDLITKVAPGARLSVTLTDTPELPISGRFFDLVSGGPAIGTDLLTVSDGHLWPQYLHRRLAWEAGGRLSLAWKRARAIAAEIQGEGDDDRLESLLNYEARTDFGLLPIKQQSEVVHDLACRLGFDSKPDMSHPNLFWHPAFLPCAMPVPWVARALLQSKEFGRFSEFLRGSLLCLPLSQELLSACLLIETQIRGRVCLPTLPPDSASCHGPWQDFDQGRSIASELYPPGSPAIPTDPWAFASLGEILRYDSRRPAGDDWRHKVRLLRNHLAHGHHVGWEALLRLRSIANRMAW